MNNVVYLLLTATFISNVCANTGFAIPCLVAYKRNFAYTAILSGVFALILILSGVSYYFIYNYLLLPFEVQFLSLVIMVTIVGIFNFIFYAIIKAINKQAFYVYEKSYTFILLYVAILGVLLSVIIDQAFEGFILTLVFSALGFMFVNFFVYGAYFKINGSYAPKYLKGLPLMLIVVSIIGMIFSVFGLLL